MHFHQINITITFEGTYIKYVIEDDGIGRERSAAINKFNKPHYKSGGLQITKERVRLHNQPGEENGIEFKDRKPSGTIVIVKIIIRNHVWTKSNFGR